MIDFHCHICPPGSKIPDPDRSFYQSLRSPIEPAEWVNDIFVETVDAIVENMRSPVFQKGYEQIMPMLYTEMTKRISATTASRLMVEMAKYNIRQAVVVAIDPYIPTEALAYECLKTKDILIPFGSVDPKSRDWKEELEKTLTLPIAGFNIHFALQEELLNTEISRQIIEIISEKRPKLPIYVHTGNFQIFKHTDKKWATSLGVLAKEFSEQTFICGHAGWSEPSLALRLALRCPNVILETSWQPARVIRRLCDRLGPRRLLLGSDYPLYSMRRAIGNCRRALNPKEFTMVSNENAKSLIKQGLSRQGLHSF